MEFDFKYWEERYNHRQTGWDVGYAAQPITDYIDQIVNKDIKILIPGAGNGWEAQYCFENGFHETYLLDIARQPLINFSKRVTEFPASHIVRQDFFSHSEKYDLILEQTFFCAIHPELREKYVEKSYQLLAEKGKVAGVIWKQPMNDDTPPFGGTCEEYIPLFEKYFDIKVLEPCDNSIKPRVDRELFFIIQKKDKV